MKYVVKQLNTRASSQYMDKKSLISMCKHTHSSDEQKAARSLTQR